MRLPDDSREYPIERQHLPLTRSSMIGFQATKKAMKLKKTRSLRCFKEGHKRQFHQTYQFPKEL
jgi:hypothetical protein